MYIFISDDIIKTFELRIQDECLNSDPKQRPKLHTFLEDKIFRYDSRYKIFSFYSRFVLQCSLPKKLMVVNIKIVKFIYENYENIVGQITLICYHLQFIGCYEDNVHIYCQSS